ncbi:glycosyl transferase [Collibacillus ludicampi]|uniref:Glycosyl transferase n=1 Tax=Collibacillus ludicampi TaxID=2771369 RepID=A0AAV4LD94_9BACL|nr:glycosyltransferase family 2 protein [Collibacillus ludicampi]GIM45643.1 glycosyl transferase [Collibacillus ludicampi]
MASAKISIVTPVYRCAPCLVQLYNRLRAALEPITADFEIIMVNDNSPDHAWEVIQELSRRDRRVKGIHFSRNFGQHYAITAGLDYASGDWVVVMDCDLQDQPEEIPKLYAKAQEGYDIVFGQRVERQDRLLKRMSSKLFYKVFSYLTDTEQDASIANFGIYHRKVIDTLVNMREKLRFFPTMVKWVGFRSTAIEIEHASREQGKSSYSWKRLLNLAFDVIISFSDKPLRLTVKLGFFMSFFSFLYALYIVIRALLGIKGIIGWPSLIVSIWFLAGLIIFILGIIGIYISKIYDEAKKRPIYIIKEVVGFEGMERADGR